jgi:16S rRNA (cytidine1402-2'-O)-methyltransferase
MAAVLSVCPLPAARYLFEGFLPAKARQRDERLQILARLDVPVVFFEAPHRMAATLEALDRIAPARRLMIGREMTKRHEQYLCDTPAELRALLAEGDQFRGEFVGVLEGGSQDRTAAEVRRTMEVLAGELPPAQAARLGAQLLGRNRRELYELALTVRDA